MARFYDKWGMEVINLRNARKEKAFPSVTTIINGGAPHEYKYLDDKRLREIVESDASYEEKMEILGNKPVFENGTLVHEAAEVYFDCGVTTTLLDCPASSQQFYKILSSIKPKEIEKYYRCKSLQTGGRLDLIAEDRGMNFIYDYKTTSTIHKKVEKSWMLQMAAYYQACLDNGEHISGARIIQFGKKNQGSTVLHITEGQLKEAVNVFSCARETFRFYYNI